MSISDASFHPHNPGIPVFRPGEFVGREGLVRNLLWRLGRGESLSVFGGPKLGKTSLLLHLACQLNQSPLHGNSLGVPVVYFDLSREGDYEQLLARQHDARSFILLDNCDQLVGNNSQFVLKTKGVGSPVLVYAGGRDWREFVRRGELREKVHSVPLAVFLEKESRLVLDRNLTTEQQAEIIAKAGTHPYVLKILQAETTHGVVSTIPTELKGQNRHSSLLSFFHRCMEEIREPMEHAVLTYLMNTTKPVNPREVARVVGLPTIKPIADTLCVLGLISRWIRNEEATLSASCTLFNKWYLGKTCSELS